MLISVVNHMTRKDEEVQEGIRAVNRQIAHDCKPYWHIAAELRLEGTINKHINPEDRSRAARRCHHLSLGQGKRR